MINVLLISCLILSSVQDIVVLAQSNGDVRLVGGEHNYEGRLEIYLKGQWGTFCGSDSTKFSRGAAEAACKQLGFLDQNGYGSINQLGYPAADSGTPIHIGSANCNYDFGVGQLHVLRCDINQELMSPDCSQDTAIGIKCLDVSLWIPSQNYEGMVRTSNESKFTSSGELEIYLNKVWGNVCGSKFDQVAADSACRQMGYTNAVMYKTTTHASQNTIWLDGVSCDSSTSCDCLNRCFHTPSFPVVCTKNNYVYISCSFDLSIKDKATSGNNEVCIEPGKCKGPENDNMNVDSIVKITFDIIVGIIFCCFVLSTITLSVCFFSSKCLLYKQRPKQLKSLHALKSCTKCYQPLEN